MNEPQFTCISMPTWMNLKTTAVNSKQKKKKKKQIAGLLTEYVTRY